MTEPAQLTLPLPGLRMQALAWGPQDGRLMLCLHGYPDTAWPWRHLGPHFAERGFRVVAPFMRGYAPTELAPDGDYSVGALMSDALALHHLLGGGSDAVVVGHDWGGLAVNGLAAYPENPFGSLVVMGVPLAASLKPGGGVFRSVVPRLPRQFRMSWYIAFQQIPGMSERALDRVIPRLWHDWCPPGYDARGDLARLWESLPDVAHRTAALSYYRAMMQPFRGDRRHRDLDSYAVQHAPRHPLLLLHGRIDGAIDARLAAASARSLPPGSRHEILEEAGHFMHLDAPQRVHEVIGGHVSA